LSGAQKVRESSCASGLVLVGEKFGLILGSNDSQVMKVSSVETEVETSAKFSGAGVVLGRLVRQTCQEGTVRKNQRLSAQGICLPGCPSSLENSSLLEWQYYIIHQHHFLI
jgi:hypothetical protein